MTRMRILKFNINEQKIEKDISCDFSNIVAGTKGYLYAQFSFSQDWNGCKKASCFVNQGKEYFAPIINGMSKIPEDALTQSIFYVYAIGEKDGYRITTNRVGVRQNG